MSDWIPEEGTAVWILAISLNLKDPIHIVPGIIESVSEGYAKLYGHSCASQLGTYIHPTEEDAVRYAQKIYDARLETIREELKILHKKAQEIDTLRTNILRMKEELCPTK